MFQKLLDIIFPRTCAVCGKILPQNEQKVCEGCYKKATLVVSPTCKKCGKPIEHTDEEYCFDCGRNPSRYIERGFAVWEYDTYMKDAIMRFKYGGRIEYADYFVEELLYHYGETLRRLKLDTVIPVPLHKDRKRFRGFNQAEVLAKKIAEGLHVEAITDLLVRTRNTKPQNGLEHKERYQNVKHAFSLTKDKNNKSLQRILLVDDIYTTGTTVNQCAEVLKNAGVKEVYVICLCIGKDF